MERDNEKLIQVFGAFQKEDCTPFPEQSSEEAERPKNENICMQSRLLGVDSFGHSHVLAEQRTSKMVMTSSGTLQMRSYDDT